MTDWTRNQNSISPIIGKMVCMKEDTLRDITRDWLDQQYVSYQKHMNFKVFHGTGPLVNYLRRKFFGSDLTSIPNHGRANVEPDIAGIIISPETGQKLWVIAEVKGNETVISQENRRQAKDYAQATNAFRAYLVSDGPLGRDVVQDIRNGMHSYTGMFENGQKGICYLEFIRYLEKSRKFITNRGRD